MKQHEQALKTANETRIRRAERKRAARAGKATFAEVIADPAVGGAMIQDVIMWMPHWGRTRSYRLLSMYRISEIRRVRDLTERQKDLLLHHVT